MKFVDSGITPAQYRWKFLDYVDKLAPEVLQTLKAMSAKFDQVINRYPYTDNLTWWITDDVDILNESEILFYLQVEKRYKLTDQDNLDIFNRKALENFYLLKKDYSDFIKNFGLDTDWLRRDLFSLLGRISNNPTYKYSLGMAYSHGWFPKEGEQFEFSYEGWKIELDSKDYEMMVRKEFEKHLNYYIEFTKKQFKKDGYKQATKPIDFDSVKWLVYWTVLRKSKKEILAMIDEEYFAQGKDIGVDRKTLDAHFRKFKQIGLPVRG